MHDLTAVFEPAEEGGYVSWFEEIPEAMSQGETIEEAKINLIDAFKLLIEANREQTEKSLVGHSVFREMVSIAAI